ncbi:uncharacterized protein LOC135377570 [Ornithodoros turicata]|uniref:uncharacterized protein LOC135377570 n=1 Tax=Ornithodoros turicata TaxID=34597 RepID=UPI00313A4B0E
MARYSETDYLCEWEDWCGGEVPCTAFIGGVDSGENIYIGRAMHGGDVLPGKIVPSHNVCYVSYEGREHPYHTCQVLVTMDDSPFGWVPDSNGRLPPGAIQGGQTEDGEPLYIGRTFHEGALTIGKIQCSHGRLYIPYGGGEHSYTSYEALVCRTPNCRSY